jgi:predicted DNA-binding protein
MGSVMMGLRLSQEIAVRVEAEAKQSGLATSELLRQIVTAHYESSQADEVASREKDAEWRFQQLIFEIGKTRSAVLRVALQTIAEGTMEKILAAATDDAKDYAALVAAGMKGLTAEPGDQSDASGS